MPENNMNTSASTEQPTVVYSQWSVYLALIFCVFFIIVGVFGNSLTILALLKSRKLRSAATSFFIISLSVTDLIFCVFNLPIIAVRYAHQKWILGDVLCQLFPFFFYLNVAASVFTIAAVTINRYVLIAHYTSYDRIYRKCFVVLMVLFCWLFPLALLLPTLAETWGRFGYTPHTFSCTILRSESGKSPKKFFFLLGFFLPVVTIVFCYARIFWIFRKSRRNMANHSRVSVERSRSSSTNPESLALTRMVLAIFSAFILCYLPLMLANVFDEKDSCPDLHVVASILAWSASVINPFIYGVMSARYRSAYASILPCCSKKVPTSTGTGTSSSGLKCSTTNGIGGKNSIKMTESAYSQACDTTILSQTQNTSFENSGLLQ